MREHVVKLNSGEYIHEWRGFTPFYIGFGLYGQSTGLGGEEKFHHCCGEFHGIASVEWWIVAELEKLTDVEKDEMECLMKRNSVFHNNVKPVLAKELSGLFGCEAYHIYRIPNIKLYNALHNVFEETYRKEG
jgi:hypothetical protein